MKRIVLLCAVLAGCIFSTRTPEPPNSSTTFIWIPATTPDLLIQNLSGALKTLDATDYIRVFISATESTNNSAKAFSFTPASDINQSSRAVFTDWGGSNEQQWVTNLASQLPPNSQITLLLTNEVEDQSSNSASLSYNYTISLPSSAPSVIPGVVQGALQFQLAFITTDEGTKEWRIISWSDYIPQSGNGPTWSDLKVDLSS
jgi:type 1 fimbria pilin